MFLQMKKFVGEIFCHKHNLNVFEELMFNNYCTFNVFIINIK